MTSYLESLSLLGVYSAIAIYAAAFVAYTIDLARRTAPVPVREAAVVGALAPARRATHMNAEADTDADDRAEITAPRVSKAARVGYALSVLGWVFHVAAAILRGIAADRVPWANMFEFSLTATALIIGTFLLVSIRVRLAYLGTAVLGLVVLLLGVATVSFYVPVVPIMPALQSAWLVIHVLIAMLATAFLGLAFLVSVLYLIKRRAERAGTPRIQRLLDTVPSTEHLDRLAYRMTTIGFILWTFTLIAGAIWASRAWGRFWGWDVKEVWTFIVWVFYAAYMHATATRGWRGAKSAWLSIVGFTAVMFNFAIVNVFFTGLHSYSGLK